MSPSEASVVVSSIATVGAFASTFLTVKYGKKSDETHKMTTVNHHSSEKPTILDRLDNIEKGQSLLFEIFNKHLKEHK
jgi:hypothetical protein